MDKRIQLAIATGAVLVVSGCGGSGTHLPSSSRLVAKAASTSSAAEQAQAICERLNSEFAAHRPVSQSISEIARVAPGRVSGERRAIEELSALKPPTSLASGMREVIAYRTKLADELADLVHDARVNDAAAIDALAKSKAQTHETLQARAKAAGLPACSLSG